MESDSMVNILKKRNKITGVYRILFEKGIIFNIHWLKSKCSVVFEIFHVESKNTEITLKMMGMSELEWISASWLCTLHQGSHSTWKTWKNESTPGKPGNIMEF